MSTSIAETPSTDSQASHLRSADDSRNTIGGERIFQSGTT
jgi:hypothetical protein